MSHFRARRTAAAVVVAAISLIGAPACTAPSPKIDQMIFNDCKPQFDENFERLDVSSAGPGTRWLAHTPWFGDFGDATFTDPRPGFPFTTGPGGLTITATKDQDPTGHWRSGLLATVNHSGQGFAAANGYFEMVARFPPGKGTWPAFWLAGADYKAPAWVEIDVVEYYGHWPDRYRATVTVRYKDGRPAYSVYTWVTVPPGSLVSADHSYGVSVGTNDIVFFLDRKEVWRTPRPIEQTRPLGVLLDLGLGSGWPINETPNPSKMEVRHVSYFSNLNDCGISPRISGNEEDSAISGLSIPVELYLDNIGAGAHRIARLAYNTVRAQILGGWGTK